MKESQKMTNYIPFVDLSTQYDAIKSKIDYAINKVLNKGEFILGEDLKIFEKSFAFYCNTKFCIGVSSGTQALHLALKAMGISKGDGIIISANTYVSTAFGISYKGAKPVLVDINLETYYIDVALIEKNIKIDPQKSYLGYYTLTRYPNNRMKK